MYDRSLAFFQSIEPSAHVLPNELSFHYSLLEIRLILYNLIRLGTHVFTPENSDHTSLTK